ncbi:MAG: DUF7424 family protein [bacterium]
MKGSLVFRVCLLIITLALSIIFLSGCNFSLSPEIYLSDLLDLKDGPNNSIAIPSTVKLEIISKDSFIENKDRITIMLQDYFGKVSKVSYEADGFNNYYVAQVNIPIVKDQKQEKIVGYAMFLIRLVEDNEGIRLILSFNNSVFNSFKDRIFEEFSQSITAENISFDITLVNDLKSDVILEVQGVYLDKYPYPFRSRYELGRRDKVNIIFSDVLRDYLVKSGDIEFAYLILK